MPGRLRLSELRDALLCPADLNLRALGMGVPSAYFYIEGTFYADRRQPGSIDYAQPVIRCRHAPCMQPDACMHVPTLCDASMECMQVLRGAPAAAAGGPRARKL